MTGLSSLRARLGLRAPRPSEASVAYRAAVLGTVTVSVVAVIGEQAVPAGTGVAALALIPAGYALSYVRRDRRNIGIKALLAILLFAAFGNFLRSVQGATSVDDARAPLAELFLWVQVLHSYDLPRRRDLSFSLASSVALLSLAGAMAISTTFGLSLLLYAAAAGTALVLGHLSELREQAGDDAAADVRRASVRRGVRSGLAKPVAAASAAAIALSAVAFMALPRLPGVKVTALPFSIPRFIPTISNFAGGVVNPGLPSAAAGDDVPAFAPDAYFGYGDSLDLRVRGRLSDRLVMRVRSPEGAFWRAQVFDRYDGKRWTSTDDEPDEVSRDFGQSITIPDGTLDRAAGRELIQTFYVERALPNLLFHALRAKEVFVPSTTVHVDAFGSIRLPFVLEEDTIYSVISTVPDVASDDLQWVPSADPADPRLERYLQVPDSLGRRFHDLARAITEPHGTQADKVLAVESWLTGNIRYNLDIPRDPPGRDPVDVFLFDRREGFCEQIASAMALLLRSVGIPARLATGFTEGRRNPLTGYWEVRNSDAHSWVEVWYPQVGWIEYDPTHEVPFAEGGTGAWSAFGATGSFLGTAIPAPLRQAAGAAGRLVVLAVRTIPALPLAVAVALVVAALAATRLRRRHDRPNDARGRVVAAWLRVERALGTIGYPRAPDQTVRELVSAVRAQAPPGVGLGDLATLADGFARTRYGRPGEEDGLAHDCEEAAERIAQGLSRAAQPTFAMRR